MATAILLTGAPLAGAYFAVAVARAATATAMIAPLATTYDVRALEPPQGPA